MSHAHKQDAVDAFAANEQQFEQQQATEAANFEKELTAKVTDPLERVKKRHTFYTQQEEQRADRLRRIGTLIKKKRDRAGSRTSRTISNRVFEAGFSNKQYHGTIVSQELALTQRSMIEQVQQQKALAKQQKMLVERQNTMEVNQQATVVAEEQVQSGVPEQHKSGAYAKRQPIFLGEDGTLYDIHYMPVHVDEQLLKTKRGKLTRILNGTAGNRASPLSIDHHPSQHQQSVDYCHDPELYQTPPSPYSFHNFEEYEEALVQWANDVQKRLGPLQLPRIMGRHYYRPYVNAQQQHTKMSSSVDQYGSSESMDIEETWEANLVPLEPKPEFYACYEDYERALKHWAVTCLGLPFLPPHPAQFQKLLGIRLSRTPLFPVPDVDSNQQSTRIQEGDDTTASLNIAASVLHQESMSKEEISVLNLWNNLSAQDQKPISDAIDALLGQKLITKGMVGTFQTKMTPKIHGFFEDGAKLMRGLPLDDLKIRSALNEEPQNVREWVSFQRQDKSVSSVFSSNTFHILEATAEDCKHQIPHRRTDFTEDQLKEANDCNDWEQDREVSFKIPDFDIGVINFDMLVKHSTNFVRFLQVLLLRMDNIRRYHNLNSWYYPTIPKKVHLDHLASLNKLFDEAILSDPLKNVSVTFIKNLYLTDAYLDTFARWLQSNVPKTFILSLKGDTLQIKTYGQILFAVLANTPQMITRILDLMHMSNSIMVHAKVSEFILQLFKTKQSEPVVLHIVQQLDIYALYNLATCASFYDEVPIILFQYTKETRELIKQIFGTIVETFVSTLLIIYYLDSIMISLLEEEKLFPQLYPQLVSEVERLLEAAHQSLLNDKQFLSSHVWSMISHRSKKISNLGYFLLSFLFNLSYNTNFYNHLQSPEVKLVDNIRKLANSKLTHVRDAVARLWVILEQKKWQSLLTTTFSDTSVVITDLMTTAERTVLDTQPPIISSLVLEFLTNSLEIKDLVSKPVLTMIKGLLDTKTFHKVFMEVVKTFHQKRLHQGSIMGAIFLARFAKLLVCHQMVTTSSSNKPRKVVRLGLFGVNRFKDKKKTKATSAADDEEEDPSLCDMNKGMEEIPARLEISYDSLMQFLDLICNDSNATNKRRVYRPRTYLLECFRHLLKCPDVFELLQNKKDKMEQIYTRFIDICKDGTDVEFNRNAWRLMYQLIKFHSCVLEQLIKSGKIENLLELMGKGDPPILMTNSFHYFHKIFNLPLDSVYLKNEITLFAKINSIPLKQAENELDPYSMESTPMFNRHKHNSHLVKLVYSKHIIEGGETEIHKRKRLQNKRGHNMPDEAVQKNYERNMRELVTYIVSRHKYIIFHKAFTELSKDYAGWAFQSLVSFYDTLNKHSSSTRIAQLLKRPEYKDGLKIITDMIIGSPTLYDGLLDKN